MLNWEKLLCSKRLRETTTEDLPHRNEFDKDYERIIYSSSLRRLQDKAQVFPLQRNDFTRTRLTHSLEVASLGRSIAWSIGEWLLTEKQVFKDFKEVKQLASLVEVSSLVHDLGNPPFGHYGEDIIRNWFKKWFSTPEYRNAEVEFGKLTEQQEQDFLLFEGNAQALRILSRLQFLNDQYGANFTYATLATLMKYPWASNSEQAKKKKKFGYFQAEEDLFNEIREHVGIDGCRHPATFLVEAADDMAYLTADIEDAVKKGVIDWENIYQRMKKELEKEFPSLFNELEIYRQKAIENQVPDKNVIDVQNFKVRAQGLMFLSVVEAFKEHYDEIMNCKFEAELIFVSKVRRLAEYLKKIAMEEVFSNKEVLTLELVGDKVISDLLNLFVSAVTRVKSDKKTKSKDEKLIHLISKNFRHIQKIDKEGRPTIEFENLTLYNRLILVTDFISGMTDGYAVNLHQELLGVKLP
ncbi:deoxyguanosinetriphosphate triphosphohydrolase [Defluviitalea saccharophila]|uniref:Deoxyguanosinetriphosphate triphosphohydrolase n=1 Tax=Defluviitalea saccharophila TaxID=879970 RepID=A0ABZ2Y875_9FIRM|nr:deoxyguanosinetriphosphate triphosphohydrolase [Candidatus Epulonipiscium sp.]